MLVSLVLALVFGTFFKSFNSRHGMLFYFEVGALLPFSIAWLMKGDVKQAVTTVVRRGARRR